MKEIWFHDFYIPMRDELLSKIISGKYGWKASNPGPVIAYPVNVSLFPDGIPDTLPAKTVIAVPWTLSRLKEERKLTLELIEGRRKTLSTTLKTLRIAAKECEKTEMYADAITTVLLMGYGIIGNARDAYNVMKFSGLAPRAKTMGEAMSLANKIRFSRGITTFAGIYNAVGMNPAALTGRGKSLPQIVLRHASSLLSVSYWGSLFASWYTGDWDLWKYGLEGHLDQQIAKRLRVFTKEVGGFGLKIAAIDRQSKMPFYNYCICKSSRVYYTPFSLPRPVSG